MEPIEKAQIKVGLRTIFLVLGCTFSIIFTTLKVYFDISYQIQKLMDMRSNDYDHNEYMRKSQDSKIDYLTEEMKYIQSEIDAQSQKKIQ